MGVRPCAREGTQGAAHEPVSQSGFHSGILLLGARQSRRVLSPCGDLPEERRRRGIIARWLRFGGLIEEPPDSATGTRTIFGPRRQGPRRVRGRDPGGAEGRFRPRRFRQSWDAGGARSPDCDSGAKSCETLPQRLL
jgi:hypothetical protein